MKKQADIKEYKNSDKTYTITIYNARYQRDFIYKLKSLLEAYLKNDKLFFGFYRNDGTNLTLSKQREIKHKINVVFLKYGNKVQLNEHLSVAKIDMNSTVYDFLPCIFDYYLDTVMFNSDVKFDEFVHFYYSYLNNKLDDIVLNHFTDMVFCYSDSGDFSICFNTEIYNVTEVRNKIYNIFYNF